jgi:hypothetical protein
MTNNYCAKSFELLMQFYIRLDVRPKTPNLEPIDFIQLYLVAIQLVRRHERGEGGVIHSYLC